MNQLKAKIKYLKSFLKSEWDFDDYPLETWKNQNAEQNDLEYGAKFTNWWSLVAHGETENQAVENLKKHLSDFKENNTEIPRPGANVPLEFTESDRIEKNEQIAVEFFDKIIGINFYDCFISDLSSLHDFDLADEQTLDKIKSEFGIVPNDKDYFLSDIFEQINEKASG
tara:strand:+ start:55 stop:561 length:507 start_codon:yes stop_codon:yes gene_type:complete